MGRISRAACQDDTIDRRPGSPWRRFEQETGDDDEEHHREHVDVSAGVVHDRLLDDPEPDGGRRDAREVSIRPMTAAARARTSTVTASALPIGTLMTPDRRKTVTKASTVVITHTVVWIRPTGTPRVAARSERSATPRMAMPIRVYRRNSAKAPEQQGHEDEHHQVVVVEGDAADLDLDVERGVRARADRCP